jgi:general secretion pathway protein F
MPTFEFTAIDRSGATRSGALAGTSSDAVRAMLERRGLVATRIAETGRVDPRPRQAGAVRMSEGQLALLTRQIATLASVAPLEETLRTLAEQAESSRQKAVLGRVHAGVLEGQRLSDAMARLGPAFPPTYRAMVAAGEATGALPQILERLADLLEKRQDVRARITSALVYPIVLAVVAIGVIIALMTFVVPRVVDQFDVSGQRLPDLTVAMIAISDLMLNWGWAISLGLAAGLAAAAWLLSMPGPRYACDALVLGLPVAGRMIRTVEAAGVSRLLSTMIASGVPVLEALQMSQQAIANRVIRRAVGVMAKDVEEGSGLSSAMRRTGVFPPLLVNLAASGESGGRLETMLERAADYLEREFRTTTSVALSLLEPAIIVIMGGIVCLVILSILLPILQINTLGV